VTNEQLEALRAVAEEGGFTSAAPRLGTTQSRLSRLVQSLEQELGTRLVIRRPRGVIPTEAGARFLVHARQALDALRAGRASLEALGTEPRGLVSLGTLATVGAYLLPASLARFHKHHPEVKIRLVEAPPDQLEEQVASGLLDMAILDLPVRRVDLVVHRLWEEEYVLCVPRGHRLASSTRPVRLAEVVGEPLVVVGGARGSQTLQALCEAHGMTPNFVVEASNPEAVRRLMERGLGIAFLPSIVAQGEGRHFRVVPVKEGGIERIVAILHRGEGYLNAASRALKADMIEGLSAAVRRAKESSRRGGLRVYRG